MKSISLGLSETIALTQDDNENPNYDLINLAYNTTFPDGCPVFTEWAMHGNFVSQRRCDLLLKGSDLLRISLSMAFRGDPFAWQLSPGMRIINAGLFFNVDFQAPASTADPSITVFAFGTLALSSVTSLFGFIAGSKTPEYRKFEVLLSLRRQPDAGLGQPPNDVIKDPALVGYEIPGNEWSLPSSAPPGSSIQDSLTSLEATVKATVVAPGPQPAGLTNVTVLLAASGSWTIFDGLQLNTVSLGMVASRNVLAPPEPFALKASMLGRAQITVNNSPYDLWCQAWFQKTPEISEFSASLTACTAGTVNSPPDTSMLTPAQLTQLSFIGNFPLAVNPEQNPPPDCPVQPGELIASTSARCSVHVAKKAEPDTWVLESIVFELNTNKSWALWPGKINLTSLNLLVDVSNPTDATIRSIQASLAAVMTIGASTVVKSELSFSSAAGGKTLIQASLQGVSTPSVDTAKMAQEITPGQSAGAIPTGSTNIDLSPSAEQPYIRFWIEPSQPTMLLSGTSAAGQLLYFVQRPDVTKEDYTWFLSIDVTRMVDVFPWLDVSITGAFNLESISIQMLNRPILVQYLITYLTIAAGTGEMAPQQLASPLDLLKYLDPQQTLVAGGWILAGVNLHGQGSMTDILALAASPTSVAHVTFYANVVSGEANMLCGLRLSKFGLFGDSLLIDGDITYQPAKSIIQGSVKLTLPDLSTYANPQLTASMLLQKNQTYVLAQLEVGREVNIDNPFDLMYNTSLGIAKVEATFTKPDGSTDPAPSSVVTIYGSLRLGPSNSTWVITASVLFVNGKARVVQGTIGSTTTDVLSDTLLVPAAPNTVKGGEWPDDLPVFAFVEASIYYAKAIAPQEPPLVIGGITYDFGYRVSATMQLFGSPFTILAKLPPDRSGLVIDGIYLKKIDLIFAQLYGYEYNTKQLPWPTLRIDTTSNPNSYGVLTGIEFFSIKGYQLSLTYQDTPSKGRLVSTIQYNGSLLGIQDPKIGIVYDDGYFYIDGWPFQRNGEDVDADYLQEAIIAASDEDSACGKLVKLVLDKTIDTEFSFSLGRPSNGQNPVVDQKTYLGCLNWSYNVYITVPGGGRTPLGKLDMDPIDITIDKGFTTTSIWAALFEFIKEQAVNVGLSLLKNPLKFAALIALMNMKGVATDVLTKLLCRKVDEDNVKDEANDRLDEHESEPQDIADSAEAILDGVEAAGSFAGAVAAFGGGIAEIAGFAALAVLFGAGISLAAKLVSLLSDPDRAKAVQDMLDKYAQLTTQLAQKQAEAQQKIINASVLSGPLTLSWSVDTPTTASALVDWSKVLPVPPAGAPPNYFGDYSMFSWDVSWGWVNDQSQSVETVSLDPMPQKTYTIQRPELVQQPAVYVWVRSTFMLNGARVTSAWSPPTPPLTHALFLPAPKGLDIVISNTPQFDSVDTSIQAATAVPYSVAFADDESKLSTPVNTVPVMDGTQKVQSPVLQFNVDPSDAGPIYGFVKQVSTNTSRYRDSPWTKSTIGLPVVHDNLGFTLVQFGSDASLEWNSLGLPPTAFTYVVMDPSGAVISPTAVSQTETGNRIQTRLSAPDFKNNTTFIFALRKIPTAANVLEPFVKQTLTFRIQLLVSDQSFVDPEKMIVELYLTSTKSLTSGGPAAVTLYLSGSSQEAQATIEYLDDTSKLAKLSAVSLSTLSVLQLDVTISQGPNVPALQSQKWNVPQLAPAPWAGNINTFYNQPMDILSINWNVFHGAAISCRMDLVALNLDPLTHGQDLPNTPNFSVPLEGINLAPLRDNKLARAQVWVTSLQGTFKTKEILVWLPDPSRWAVAEQAQNTSTIATRSSLSNMQYLTPGTNLGALWWLSGDCSNIEGNVRSDNADTWTSSEVTASLGGGPAASPGTAVASCSRQPGHQEVFWIDSQGGIRGVWRLGGPFQPPHDYPFTGPGTASLVRGGSLAAASCDEDTMDLWYVSPNFNIYNAHWYGGRTTGWSSPTVAVSGVDADDGYFSFVSICPTGSGSVELFWIKKEGNTLVIYNARCNDTNASSQQYTQQIVSNGAIPQSNSKIHAVYLPQTNTVMIAWITVQGAVWATSRKASMDGGTLPPWAPIWSIAPQMSASLSSRISSSLWNTASSTMPSFFWVVPDGRLAVAQYGAGTTTLVPGGGQQDYLYWSSYKHPVVVQGPSFTRAEVAPYAVASGDTQSVRIFYVGGGDSLVYSLRYPKEGSNPWP